MIEFYIKPEHVAPEDAQKVLEFLNSAKSAKEIATSVEIPDERDVGATVAQHILNKRRELGGFTSLEQVANVRHVGPERFTEIVTTLCGKQATEIITTLQTFFSLTPLSPWVYTYDAANPDAPYSTAYLYTGGGVTYPQGYGLDLRFVDQYNNDEIIVGWDAVPLDNQELYAGGDSPYHHSMIRLTFTGRNVSTQNQYLLIFGFRGIANNPSAQFFIGADLVDTVELTGNEQHAILLDCLGNGSTVDIYVRLASPSIWALMGFKGVDCYLL